MFIEKLPARRRQALLFVASLLLLVGVLGGCDSIFEGPCLQPKCAGKCVDTKTNRYHCGGCGIVCNDSSVCQAGKCVCAAGRVACDGICTNVQTDIQHCGACNKNCSAGQTCQDGSCLCATGRSSCDGVCVDTNTNKQHCGACGQSCKTDESCQNGTCTPLSWAQKAGSNASFPEAGNGIAIAKDGSIYITGYFRGTATFGSTTLTSKGNQDAFVAKLNPSGAFIWAKGFGGTADDRGIDVLLSPNDFVYVVAHIAGAVTLGSQTITPQGNSAALLVSWNPNGTFVSAKPFDSTSEFTVRGTASDDSGVVLVGEFSGTTTQGPTTLTAKGTRDCFLLKVGWSGQLTWARQLGGNGSEEYCSKIAVRKNGDLAISGYFKGTMTIGSQNYTATGDFDGFLTYMTAQGNISWTKLLSGAPKDVAPKGIGASVQFDANGDIVWSGRFTGSVTLGTTVMKSESLLDTFVSRWEPNGTMRWVRHIKSTDSVSILDVAIDQQGQVYLTGEATGITTFGSLQTDNQSISMFVATIDRTGKWLWARHSRTSATTVGWALGEAIAIDSSGNYYTTGRASGTVAFGQTSFSLSRDIVITKNLTTCPNGQCSVCVGGQQKCGDTCVDTQSDSNHCGGCLQQCPNDGACVAGKCGCKLGFASCNGECIDVQTSSQHCGACGNACANGQPCENGLCKCENSKTRCGDVCVDTQASVKHCGACNQACGKGEDCTNGTCACSIFFPTTCGGACVNTGNDRAHCGGCNQACADGMSCSNGKCVCPFGRSSCDNKCVDTKSDNKHCGACGNACPTDATCKNGTCQCSQGLQLCSGTPTCVDLSKTNKHCGACSISCQTNENCRKSLCHRDYLELQHTGNAYITHLEVDASGNIYLLGRFNATVSFGTTTFTTKKQNTYNVFVAKLAPTAKSWLWTRHLENNQSGVFSHGLALDSSGHVYISGTASGLLTVGSSTLLQGPALRFDFLAKLSPAGSWLWAKGLGRHGSGRAVPDLFIDTANHIYLSGRFKNNMTVDTVTLQAKNGLPGSLSHNCYIFKLNANGKALWGQALQPSTNSLSPFRLTIAVDSSQNVYIAGRFFRSARIGTLDIFAPNAEATFLAALSPSGAWSWVRHTKGAASSYAAPETLVVGTNGNIFLTGNYRGNITIGTNTLSSQGTDVFVAALSSSSKNWLWSSRIGLSGDDGSKALVVHPTSSNLTLLFDVVVKANERLSVGSVSLPLGVGGTILGEISPSGQWSSLKKVKGGSEQILFDREQRLNTIGRRNILNPPSIRMFFSREP